MEWRERGREGDAIGSNCQTGRIEGGSLSAPLGASCSPRITRSLLRPERLSFNIPTQKNIRKRKCHTFSFGRCVVWASPVVHLSARQRVSLILRRPSWPRGDAPASTDRRICTEKTNAIARYRGIYAGTQCWKRRYLWKSVKAMKGKETKNIRMKLTRVFFIRN